MPRNSTACFPHWVAVPQQATPIRLGLNLANFGAALTWLIFPLTLGFAITRQSLWIDEGYTVWFASHASLRSFFVALIGSRGAPGDPQFIFYLLHVWAWVKLFGASELSLRAANVPFAVILMYSMSWASQHLFWNRRVWTLCCLSPFFWFYLNEARPYIALLAFSTVATIAIVAYCSNPGRYGKLAPWFCLGALFLAWGTHVLAAFLFPCLLFFVAIMVAKDPALKTDFIRRWLRPLLWWSPAFLALGTFYAYVSSYGINKVDAKPGLQNLAFALYEFGGFAGLGPPRNDIRQHPALSVFAPYWPTLLFGIIAVVTVIVFVLRAKPSRIARTMLLSAAAGLAVAMLFSAALNFQVLGRHLSVFLPVLSIPFLLPPDSSGASPRRSRKLAMAAFAVGVAWAISDFRLVFMTKYQKDSYREACSLALSKAQVEGARILWVAEPVTARYYGLTVTPLDTQPSPVELPGDVSWSVRGNAVDARSWRPHQAEMFLRSSTLPIIVVLSKPETSDPNGAWLPLVASGKLKPVARLNAFSVFEWQPESSNSI